MRTTKLDMAKVIVQALFGLPNLPSDDHHEVRHLARRKKSQLVNQHEQACAILHKKALQERPGTEKKESVTEEDFLPLVKTEREQGYAASNQTISWLIAEVERLRKIEDATRPLDGLRGIRQASRCLEIEKVLRANPRPGSDQ